MPDPPAPAAATLVVGGDELALHVTGADSHGALLAADVRLPPGGGPPVRHRHDPFELYRVTSGELAVYLAAGDGVVRRGAAGPGDVVAIPTRPLAAVA